MGANSDRVQRDYNKEQDSRINRSKLSGGNKRPAKSGLGVQDPSMIRESHITSTRVINNGKEKVLRDGNGDSEVFVREENVNLKGSGGAVKGFTDAKYADKNIRKFELSALVHQKELIKESNYFDESRDGRHSLTSSAKPAQADFRTGNFDSFQTCQVKTFLFDRQLNDKIIA